MANLEAFRWKFSSSTNLKIGRSACGVLRCWFPFEEHKQSNFFCEGKTKTYMSRPEG